ncbi:hypothetical protein L1D34_30035 [Vibrio mediterranei]|nr:hypothetical protein [Vibrio mediterranei]
MITKIKKTRKRMAKVQQRTYGVRVRSGRSTLYNHLINDDNSQKILSHLGVGFEQNLFLASLENLSDKGNPVRFNNFAYCMREIISIILAKYSDDDEIQRCAWFVPPSDTTVTRKQRVIYSICGGLELEYVKREVLQIEEDEENILDQTLKVFGKKFGELSKYTHVRSDSSFNISNDLCEKLSKEVLKLTSDIVRLVEQCRSEIQNLVREQISETVTQEALTTTLEGLDILSSHGHVNDVEISEFSVDDIDSQWLKIKGTGYAYCTLVWGSGSDFRNDNGATMDEDFPLNFTAHIPLGNFNDVQIFEGDIDVDNREWFGE